MRQVMQAQAYRYGAMGSLGDASYMLIRQVNFPAEYDPAVDEFMTADDDRLLSWDYDHTRACFKKYTGSGELRFGEWAQGASEEDLMECIKALLKADRLIDWTGCRVLGTVHRGNGYPVWTLQLFANKSGVKVYSGPFAPNVEKSDDDICFGWLRK